MAKAVGLDSGLLKPRMYSYILGTETMCYDSLTVYNIEPCSCIDILLPMTYVP